MLTQAVGSQIAKLIGAPEDPTEQYKKSITRTETPSQIEENRLINASEARVGMAIYHQTEPVPPKRQNNN
jgi:hypothetical protein